MCYSWSRNTHCVLGRVPDYIYINGATRYGKGAHIRYKAVEIQVLTT